MELNREEIRKLLHAQFVQGNNATIASENINQMMGRRVLDKRTAQRWFNHFREGRVDIKHKKGAGRPVLVDKTNLQHRLEQNPTASSSELCRGICSSRTARRWLNSIGRRWRRGRNIPHDLTPAQKQNRVTTCQQLRQRHRNGTLRLNRIITCDESWVCYDGRVKRPQWLLPNQPAHPTQVVPGHAPKRMLCFFWSMQGPVFWELLPRGATINSNLYCTQLTAVNTAAQVRTALGHRNGPVVFHQDNARPHMSIQTRAHIQQTLNWELLAHPPYSPDLAPSDFHVFRSLKNFLRGRRFQNDEQLENAVGQWIASKMGTNFWERGIRKLPQRWRIVQLQQGDYIID